MTEGYALFVNMNHKHGFVKRAADFPNKRTLCTDAHRINYVYQKMESQGNIAYLWEKDYNDIGAPLDFRQKTYFKTRRCCNINTRLESRRGKHNVVTTLVFGRSNNVGNTTL